MTTLPVEPTRWHNVATAPESATSFQGNTALAKAAFAIALSSRGATRVADGMVSATTVGTPVPVIGSAIADPPLDVSASAGVAPLDSGADTSGPATGGGAVDGAPGVVVTVFGDAAVRPGNTTVALGKPKPSTALVSAIIRPEVQRCPGVIELRTRRSARSSPSTLPTRRRQTTLGPGTFSSRSLIATGSQLV